MPGATLLLEKQKPEDTECALCGASFERLTEFPRTCPEVDGGENFMVTAKR